MNTTTLNAITNFATLTSELLTFILSTFFRYLLPIIILIHFLLSLKMSKIAREKGYKRLRYFFLCFIFSLAGFAIVAALPDLILHRHLNDLNAIMNRNNKYN